MQVIILNADFTYLNVVNWKKAVKLIINQKAVVIKESDKQLVNYEKTFKLKIPSVLKLVNMVCSVYHNKVPYSKKSILTRDQYICQYCGSKKGMTIDHIIPSSRGGKTSFLNCVACCTVCNVKKDNKTPEEAHMKLTRAPHEPTVAEFLMHKTNALDVLYFIN